MNDISDTALTDNHDEPLIHRAIQHHTNCLLHTGITLLYIHSSSNKQQWKSIIISDIYYKHILWGSTYQQWRYMYRLELMQSDNDTLAVLHYNKVLQTVVLYNWCILHTVPLVKRAVIRYADQLGNKNILKRIFHQLRNCANSYKQYKLYCAQQCIYKWRRYIRLRHIRCNRLIQCNHTINLIHKRNGLDTWRNYCILLHRKDMHCDAYISHCTAQFIRHTTHLWQYNTIHHHQHSLLVRGDTYCRDKHVKFALMQLAQYTSMKLLHQHNQSMAIELHTNKLQSIMINIWLTVYRQCVSHKQNNNIALQFCNMQLTKHAMHQWNSITQSRQYEFDRLHHADLHYMKQYVKQWYDVSSYRLNNELMERAARRYNYLSTIYTVVYIWYRPIQYELYQSVHHNNITILSNRYKLRLLQFWYMSMKLNRHHRVQLANAYEFYRHHQLKCAVQHIHQITATHINSTQQRNDAVKYYKCRLKHKLMLIWKQYTAQQNCKRNRQQLLCTNARNRLNHILMKQCYNHWLYLTHNIICTIQYMNRADTQRITYNQRNVVKCMKQMVFHHKQCLTDTNTAIQQYNNTLQLHTFNIWYNISQCQSIELNKYITAIQHWSTTTCTYIWSKWMAYHKQQQYERQRQSGALQQYKYNMLRFSVAHWITSATHNCQHNINTMIQHQSVQSIRLHQLVTRIAYYWYNKTFIRHNILHKPLFKLLSCKSVDINGDGIPLPDLSDQHIPNYNSTKSYPPSMIKTARSVVEPSINHISLCRRNTMPTRSKTISVAHPIKQRAQPRNSLAIVSNNNTLPSRSHSLTQSTTVLTPEQRIEQIELQLHRYVQQQQQHNNNMQQYQQYITVLNRVQSDDTIQHEFTTDELNQIIQQCETLYESIQLYDTNKSHTQYNIRQLMQQLHELTHIVQ